VLAHRAQFHQKRLVEFVNPSGSQYQDTLKQMTDYFLVHGSSFAQALQQAFTWISQQVQLQASYLAYIDSSGFFQRHKISFKKSLRAFCLTVISVTICPRLRDIAKHHRIARFRVRNNLLSWKFGRRCVAQMRERETLVFLELSSDS
jgi:hypothetical protein